MARIELNDLPVDDELTSEERRETIGGSSGVIRSLSSIRAESQDSAQIGVSLKMYQCPDDQD
jgi:hypothetical protein